jgi:hypothetical protein
MVCDDWLWKLFIGLAFKGHGMMSGFRSSLAHSLGVKGFKILSMITTPHLTAAMALPSLPSIRRKHRDIPWYTRSTSLAHPILARLAYIPWSGRLSTDEAD